MDFSRELLRDSLVEWARRMNDNDFLAGDVIWWGWGGYCLLLLPLPAPPPPPTTVLLLLLGGEVSELSDEDDIELAFVNLGVDFSKKRFFGGNAEVIMVLPDLAFLESRCKLHACEPPNLRFNDETDAFADSACDFFVVFTLADDLDEAALSNASPCCNTTDGDRF